MRNFQHEQNVTKPENEAVMVHLRVSSRKRSLERSAAEETVKKDTFNETDEVRFCGRALEFLSI